MMDFTLLIYRKLLESMIRGGYSFQTFEDFIRDPLPRSIVLRHDVDLLPHNSLVFAQIQATFGVKGVYYFRAVPESWDEKVIKEIHTLGHEIGYHYECLTTTHGDLEKGINDFEINLAALRELVPVSTICMHGSPMSKFDSKDLWLKYNYRDYGIIGEPYFDIDFSRVFYLTDTGRSWDGDSVSVRDKVNTDYTQKFHSTPEIIKALDESSLPYKIMVTFHPQRWTDNYFLWYKELVWQNFKNQLKKHFFVK